jgi:putative endonuclease
MPHYVYVLRSAKDKNRYIGLTNSIEERLSQHNAGKVISTRNRIPLELIYFERYENRSEAAQREKFLKTGKGREYLNKNGIK